jgi:hypothetical protein
MQRIPPFALLAKVASAQPYGVNTPPQPNPMGAPQQTRPLDMERGYKVKPNEHGVYNPYDTPTQGGSVGGMVAGLGADVLAATNPVTGTLWFGGKAINDFSKGNWGSGLMNVGLGLTSWLPGVGVGAAAARGAVGAAKVTGRVAQGWQKAKQLYGGAHLAANNMRGIGRARQWYGNQNPWMRGGIQFGAPIAGGVAGGMLEAPPPVSAGEASGYDRDSNIGQAARMFAGDY